jgi:hypothetical protein
LTFVGHLLAAGFPLSSFEFGTRIVGGRWRK